MLTLVLPCKGSPRSLVIFWCWTAMKAMVKALPNNTDFNSSLIHLQPLNNMHIFIPQWIFCLQLGLHHSHALLFSQHARHGRSPGEESSCRAEDLHLGRWRTASTLHEGEMAGCADAVPDDIVEILWYLVATTILELCRLKELPRGDTALSALFVSLSHPLLHSFYMKNEQMQKMHWLIRMQFHL